MMYINPAILCEKANYEYVMIVNNKLITKVGAFGGRKLEAERKEFWHDEYLKCICEICICSRWKNILNKR